jgi:hypothetical protein
LTTLLSNVKIIVCRRGVNRFPLVSVGAILPPLAIITIILRVTIAVPRIGTARTITVAAAFAVIVAVTVSPVVFPRGVLACATTWGRWTATAWRSATSTITVTPRFETPGSGRRRTCPFNLQYVITTKTLVVHLVVRIISIAAILVLNKGKQSAWCGTRSWDIAAH